MVYNFFFPTYTNNLNILIITLSLVTQTLNYGASRYWNFSHSFFLFFFFAVDSTFFSRRVQDQRIRLVNLEL